MKAYVEADKVVHGFAVTPKNSVRCMMIKGKDEILYHLSDVGRLLSFNNAYSVLRSFDRNDLPSITTPIKKRLQRFALPDTISFYLETIAQDSGNIKLFEDFLAGSQLKFPAPTELQTRRSVQKQPSAPRDARESQLIDKVLAVEDAPRTEPEKPVYDDAQKKPAVDAKVTETDAEETTIPDMTVDEYKTLVQKAAYYDSCIGSTEILSTTTVAMDYGMQVTKFNNLLAELGIQYRDVNGSWLLTEALFDKGYRANKVKCVPNRDGGFRTVTYSGWTQRGRAFLYDLLHDNGYYTVTERDELKRVNV